MDDFYENMDLKKSFYSYMETLWYSRLPCFDVKGTTGRYDKSVLAQHCM
jgi:hypothetical protein